MAGSVVLLLPRLHRRDVLYYQRGLLHLDAGDADAALASFRMALAKNTTMRDAQVGVVRALDAKRDYAGAEQELDKAVGMGLPEGDAAVLRANIFAERGTYRINGPRAGVTVELSDSVISNDLDPAIALLQEHADKAGEPARAHARLGDLLMQKSQVLSISWQLHRNQRDRDKAVGRTDDAALNEKQATEALSLMGQSQQDAMLAYARALELDPKLQGPRLAIAQHALSSYVPQPERARKVLEPLIAQTPDHRGARLQMALVERMEGNYDKALANLAAARPKGEEDFELMVAKGQILADMKSWDELLLLTARLVQIKPSDPWANYLRASSLLKSQQPDAAKRKEALQEAVNCLQVIFQRNIGWPQARLALAQALDDLGNKEQARSAYKHTVDDIAAGEATTVQQAREILDVAYEARMALYRALKDENPDAARENARGAFQARPDQEDAYQAARTTMLAKGEAPSVMELIAVAHAAAIRLKGNVDAAVAACDAALAEPLAPAWGQELGLLRARLLVTKGSYTEAVKAYEGMLAKWPDKRASSELASLHMRFGRTDEARAVYEDAVRASPGDADAMVALLELLTRTGKTEEAREVLSKAEQQLGPESTQALMLGLDLREGQLGQAVNIGRALVEADPKKVGPHVLLAELLWRQGDLAGARGAFDDGLALDPAYLPAYRRALLDLQEAKYDLAVEFMRNAAKQFSGQFAVSTQLAIAEQAAGNPAASVDLLEKALAVQGIPQASSDAMHWFLAVAHAAMGDTAKARVDNQAVGASELGPVDARQDLLDHVAGMDAASRGKVATALDLLVMFVRNRRPDVAIAQARTLQALLPDEPLPPCLQASLLNEEGKHKEAADAYQAVVNAHPNFLYARLKLVDSLQAAGDKDAAARALEEMLTRLTPSQAALVRFPLGRMHEDQGQLDLAIADYKAAMADPQALPLAANNLAWLLVTARNDPAGALPYARQAAQAAPTEPNIADTLGWVCYLNGDLGEAVTQLERAKAAMGTNPTVRYHLGMAYQKAGRPDDARSELREALAISNTFPEAADAARALGAP